MLAHWGTSGQMCQVIESQHFKPRECACCLFKMIWEAEEESKREDFRKWERMQTEKEGVGQQVRERERCSGKS